eukprot:m.22308 g.22308  ORF g.22308 m.22308 type:complete len:385 (-) comp8377_c0_seq1:4164-5318(-)
MDSNARAHTITVDRPALIEKTPSIAPSSNEPLTKLASSLLLRKDTLSPSTAGSLASGPNSPMAHFVPDGDRASDTPRVQSRVGVSRDSSPHLDSDVPALDAPVQFHTTPPLTPKPVLTTSPPQTPSHVTSVSTERASCSTRKARAPQLLRKLDSGISFVFNLNQKSVDVTSRYVRSQRPGIDEPVEKLSIEDTASTAAIANRSPAKAKRSAKRSATSTPPRQVVSERLQAKRAATAVLQVAETDSEEEYDELYFEQPQHHHHYHQPQQQQQPQQLVVAVPKKPSTPVKVTAPKHPKPVSKPQKPAQVRPQGRKPKTCSCCKTTNTPLWRDLSSDTPLCNACGIRYKKYGLICTSCRYVPCKHEREERSCPKCHSKFGKRGKTRA